MRRRAVEAPLSARHVKAVAVAALFAAGFLLADVLAAHGQAFDTTTETTTVTTTSTLHETTTAPGTTVVTTTTVPTTAPTTTSSASSTGNTPTWVWVALAVLAAAVVGLAVALITRGGGGGGAAIPPGERRRRLDAAVATWAAQGWALQSESADSAVLQRGPEQMVITVDDAGRVATRPLGRP
jgi:hypothetical protein